MTTEKVSLTREKETLLITLYGKGEESRMPDSLLHDHFAAEAVSRIDYDFARLKVTRDIMIGLAMRAHLFDSWTREFLARHANATVLHLGCGLDSRVFRIDPGPDVRWFDVDYPEVVALRRRLYPARRNYTLIGSSVTDLAWLDTVAATGPTLIVAEGLTPYLHRDDGFRLFERLTTQFASGELMFDAYGRLGICLVKYNPSIRATGASMHWSIEDPHEFEARIPRLTLLTVLPAYDPEGYDPRQVARMSWPARLTIRLLKAIPGFRRTGQILRYRF
jgi:O-methyltransferase involved in polyketide biosynthesis